MNTARWPRTGGPDHAGDAAATLRIHEALAGRGRVYDGERLLAEVDYQIKDVQEVHRAVPGERSIYGVFKSPPARVLAGYVGTRLTLQLHDGRSFHFTVAKVLDTGAILIQGLGGFQ